MNLRLLHDEYRESCRREGEVAMGYTKSCGDYGTWTAANNLTKRIEQKGGQSCEVDWSGRHAGEGPGEPRYRRGLEDLCVLSTASEQKSHRFLSRIRT